MRYSRTTFLWAIVCGIPTGAGCGGSDFTELFDGDSGSTLSNRTSPDDGDGGRLPPEAGQGLAVDGSAMDSGTPVDAGTTDSALPCAQHGYTGMLATFDLTAETGDEAAAPATTSATGIRVGALTRASALIPASASGSINSRNWPTASSADPARYYTFTVTPPMGCSLVLTSLALSVSASSDGPTKAYVATSVDGFSTHATPFSSTTSTTVKLAAVGNPATVEVRLYAYGASNTGGTGRIQSTMILSGAID